MDREKQIEKINEFMMQGFNKQLSKQDLYNVFNIINTSPEVSRGDVEIGQKRVWNKDTKNEICFTVLEFNGNRVKIKDSVARYVYLDLVKKSELID